MSEHSSLEERILRLPTSLVKTVLANAVSHQYFLSACFASGSLKSATNTKIDVRNLVRYLIEPIISVVREALQGVDNEVDTASLPHKSWGFTRSLPSLHGEAASSSNASSMTMPVATARYSSCHSLSFPVYRTVKSELLRDFPCLKTDGYIAELERSSTFACPDSLAAMLRAYDLPSDIFQVSRV